MHWVLYCWQPAFAFSIDNRQMESWAGASAPTRCTRGAISEKLAGVIIGVMQITMDKFRRIIIPKVLRDHLGLQPGCRLDLEESLEGLVLKAAQSNSFLERV